MASIRCYDNSKDIVTLIITNFWLYLIQLWCHVVGGTDPEKPFLATVSPKRYFSPLLPLFFFTLLEYSFSKKMFQCYQRLLFVSASSFLLRQRPITACSIHIMIVQYRTDAWQTWILFVYYTNTMWWMLVLYNDWQEKRDRFTTSLVTLDFSRIFASLGII